MNKALADRWGAIAVACCVGLVATIVAWQLIPNPTVRGAVDALLLSIPALAPAFGLWRRSRYTFRWATLCVIPYFVVGMTEVIANPAARLWSSVVLALSLAWFVSLIAYLRVTKYATA